MLIYLQLIDAPEERSKFEALYMQYRGLMLYVARRILRRQEDAEDAVHDACIKIAKSISKISAIDCPETRAYIVIIVENTCIDLLRKRRRHPVHGKRRCRGSFRRRYVQGNRFAVHSAWRTDYSGLDGAENSAFTGKFTGIS